MCREKPGPRCSNHAAKAITRAEAAVAAAFAAVDAARDTDPPATQEQMDALIAKRSAALTALTAAEDAYEITPAGQRALATKAADLLRSGDLDRATVVQARLTAAVAARAKQVHDLGSAEAMYTMMGALNGLDDAQAVSVWRGAWDRAQPLKKPPKQEAWEAFVDERIDRLAISDIGPEQFDALYRALHKARAAAPDAHTFAAMKLLDERADKAVRAVKRQQDGIAALRGAPLAEVQERYEAFRAQYLADYANLPASERPDPPAEWVRGYSKKDMMAVSSPQDRATQYAMYRCQADPDAFETNPDQRFASIDLETAGPEGKDGFSPENGAIIEVGIVETDAYGTEVGRYSQLIHPGQEVLSRCGTGAVQVHGITPADVAGKPSWASVAPQIAARLNGRVMLAQNARFERDWLGHHMAAQDQPFEYYGPTVDTLTIARQYFADSPNHRLSTVCEKVGVAYTDGHRAEHDADVTVKAFFAMQAHIRAQYLSCPKRAAAPQPPKRPAGRRSQVTRLRAGEFDPAAAAGEWATSPSPAA